MYRNAIKNCVGVKLFDIKIMSHYLRHKPSVEIISLFIRCSIVFFLYINHIIKLKLDNGFNNCCMIIATA